MTLQHGVLELDADVDGDGNQETGVFEMVGDLEFGQDIIADHILSRELGNINSVLTGFSGSLKSKRTSFYVDLGDGVNRFNINFLGWEGVNAGHQWGDGSSDPVADATGSSPYHQAQCLAEYLRMGEYDSRDEDARLRIGEYSDGTYAEDGSDGVYDDYIHVTVKNYSLNRVADNPVAFDGSITLEETQDLTGPVDIAAQELF